MTETTDGAGAMHVDTALVRQLAELLDEGRLTEIEVQDGDRRIRVARAQAVSVPAPVPAQSYAPPPVAAPAADAPPALAGPDLSAAIKSPMVGTVYLSPEPGAEQFVSVGDSVKAGDTLVIIEAMKVMNPIVAPAAGVVKALLIEDGQPVEFDQPLAIVA